MTKTFSQALKEAMTARGLSSRELSEMSGVSKAQIDKIRQRPDPRTNVEDARAMAAAFGQTIEEFIDSPTKKADDDLGALLRQLTPEQQDFLRNAVKAQIASGDQSQKEPQE